MKEIGAKIREARLAKGLSVRELFEKTRIAESAIEDIENGRAERLPRTYYRIFIRTLCRELGLDSESLLREADVGETADSDSSDASGAWKSVLRESLPKTRLLPKGLGLLFLGILLVGVVLVLYLGWGIRLFREPKTSHANPVGPDSSLTFPFDSTQTGTFTVLASAQARSWIEVQIDSGRFDEVLIEKGGRRDWTANRLLFLGLEKPWALGLTMRGKPLEWVKGDTADGVDLWIRPNGIVEQSFRKVSFRSVKSETDTVPPLVGHVELRELEQKYPIFRRNRIQYRPDTTVVVKIQALNPKLSVVCFFGTWDPESRDLVPKIVKVLEAGSLSGISMTCIGVNRNNRDLAGMAEFHRVEKVPTVLFLVRGNELERLVGVPPESVETRLLAIVERSTHF